MNALHEDLAERLKSRQIVGVIRAVHPDKSQESQATLTIDTEFGFLMPGGSSVTLDGIVEIYYPRMHKENLFVKFYWSQSRGKYKARSIDLLAKDDYTKRVGELMRVVEEVLVEHHVTLNKYREKLEADEAAVSALSESQKRNEQKLKAEESELNDKRSKLDVIWKAVEEVRAENRRQNLVLDDRRRELDEQSATIEERQKQIDRWAPILERSGLLSPNSLKKPRSFGVQKALSRLQMVMHGDLGKRTTPPLSPQEERSLLAALSAWSSGALVLLNGPVGVGKTHIIGTIAQALSGSKNMATVIPVRPNWLDASDLLGYYDPSSELFRPSPFLNTIADAGAPDRENWLHVIGLDEINLSRFENYAADVMSRLEYSSVSKGNGKIDLYSNDIQRLRWDTLLRKGAQLSTDVTEQNLLKYPASIQMPRNIVIIGTLNTDESTFDLSPKLIDRSFLVDFPSSQLPTNLGFQASVETPDEFLDLDALRLSIDTADLMPFHASWNSLIGLSRDFFEAGLGMPLGHRFLNHFRAWACVCTVLGIDQKTAVSHFYICKVLPRIRFSKSSLGQAKDGTRIVERLIDLLKISVKESEHRHELGPLAAQIENDVDMVRYVGRKDV